MQTTQKQLLKNRLKFSVKVSSQEMEKYFDKEYQKLAPTINIPGFRPGMAPKVMTIESIGQAKLANLAMQKAIDDSFRKIMVENSVYPVAQPSFTISQYPAFGNDPTHNELAYEVEFDILPEVKIGNYKKIKVAKIDQDKLKVSDQEIEQVVNYLLKQRAHLKEIDRPVKLGDWAELSFKGSLKNVENEKLSSKNFPAVIGETPMVKGFDENVIGLKKGESKEFDLIFPKDFPSREFRGQKVHFDLKLNEAKEIELPKLDSAFAKNFGLTSVADLRKQIKSSLEKEKMDRELGIQRVKISDEVVKLTRVGLSKSLIESESARLRQVLEEDLSKKGTNLKQYSENLKLPEEKIKKDLDKQAERNIMLGVGLREIAKREKIEFTGPESGEKVYERIREIGLKR